MARGTPKTSLIIVLATSLVLLTCCGCGGDSNHSGRLKLHPIYESALWGAAIGGIIGYQSDEAGEGAALGAVIFGVGELLQQTDRMPPEQHKKKQQEQNKDEETQEVVIQVPNDNGSFTPVVLKRKNGDYIGPNGEHYKRLPTAEQLKPVYGL